LHRKKCPRIAFYPIGPLVGLKLKICGVTRTVLLLVKMVVAGQDGRAGGHCHRPRECAGWDGGGQEGRTGALD
jgi:hypothetical protein